MKKKKYCKNTEKEVFASHLEIKEGESVFAISNRILFHSYPEIPKPGCIALISELEMLQSLQALE